MGDPKKKGADAKRRGQQPHELAYQRKKAARKGTAQAAPGKKTAKKVAPKKKAAAK